MSKNFVYDYYEIAIPADCFDEMTDAASYAIESARERTKIYAIPCKWECKLISGELGGFGDLIFKVTRIRPKKRKSTFFGTPNFVNRDSAYLYYQKLGYSDSDVNDKIANGEIFIGKPKLKKGEKLSVIPGENRYRIERV